MRRFLLAITATFAIASASTLAMTSADAMTLGAPNGLRAAIEDTNLAEDVAYVCRRSWSCGYYGCGWRRVCRYTGYRYYRPYRRYRYY